MEIAYLATKMRRYRHQYLAIVVRTCIIMMLCLMTQSVYGQRVSTKGTDFWVTFMQNSGTPELYLFFGSDSAATATVTLGAATLGSVAIPANSNVAFKVADLSAYIKTSDLVAVDKAVRVTSDKPITVCAFNTESQSTDATVVYPVQALGDEHYIASYRHNATDNWASQGSVIAIEDGTVVEITPSAYVAKNGGGTRAPGVPYTVILNQGDVYQFQSEFAADDLTGTRVRIVGGVRECSRIAVFSGHQRTPVPYTSTQTRDHLIEQIPPLWSLGRRFLVPPLATATKYIVRVVASEPQTSVTIDGATATLPTAGTWLERTLPATNAYVVDSDKPVMTTWIAMSWTDGFDLVKGVGDPFMIVLPPVEQRIETFTFTAFVPPTTTVPQFVEKWRENLYVTIIAAAGDLDDVLLDGQRVGTITAGLAAPSLVSDGTTANALSYAVIRVSEGVHRVEDTVGSGVIGLMYGLAYFDSYGFIAGAQVANLRTTIKVKTPPFCPGKEIVFEGHSLDSAAITDWSWFVPHDGSRGNGKVFRKIFQDTGTYTVRLVVLRSGCIRDTITTKVTIRQPFTISASAQPDTICVGSTTVLAITDSSGVAGLAYRWRLLRGHSAALDDTVGSSVRLRANSPGEVVVRVIATDPGGCWHDDTVSIRVIPAPELLVTGDTVMCLGDTIALGVQIRDSLPVTITWQSTDTDATILRVADSTRATMYYVGTGVGTAVVKISATNSAGCTTQQDIHLRVAPRPLIEPSGRIRIETCLDSAGTPIEIGASLNISGGRPPYTFEWLEEDGGVSSILSSTNQKTVRIAPERSTVYILRVRDSNTPAACAAEVRIDVVLGSKPEVLAGQDQTICACSDSSVRIQAIARCGTPPYRYTWSPMSGLTVPDPRTPEVVVAKPMVSTRYIVSIVDQNNQVRADTVSVNVEECPTVSIKDTVRICNQDDSVRVVAEVQGGTGPYRYEWRPQRGVLADSGRVAWLRLPRDTNTESYSLSVLSAAGCMGEGRVVLQRRTGLAVRIKADGRPDSLCRGSSLTLSAEALGGKPPFQYRWTSSSLQQVWSEDNDTITVRPMIRTTFYVEVIDSLGCTGIDSILVDVYQRPQVVAGPDTTLCPDDVRRLGIARSATAFCVMGPVIYDWQPRNLVEVPDTTKPWSVILRPQTTTTFTVRVIDEGGFGVAAYDTIRVVVLPEMTARLSHDTVRWCSITDAPSISVSVTGGVPPYRHQWTIGADVIHEAVTDSITVFKPSVLNVAAQQAWMNIRTMDSKGCIRVDSIFIDRSRAPSVSILGIDTICPCTATQLETRILGGTAFTGGVFRIQWFERKDHGSEWAPLSEDTSTITVRPDVTTIYRVVVEDSLGCLTLSEHTIVVLQGRGGLTIESPRISADPRSEDVPLIFTVRTGSSAPRCGISSVRGTLRYNQSLYDPYPTLEDGVILSTAYASEGAETYRLVTFERRALHRLSDGDTLLVFHGKALVGSPGVTAISMLNVVFQSSCGDDTIAVLPGILTLDSICFSPDSAQRLLIFTTLGIVSIRPNPSNGDVRVTVYTTEAGTLDLEVFSVTGERVHSVTEVVDHSGFQLFDIPLVCDLPPGGYVLRIGMHGRVTTTPMVVVP